MRCEPFLSSLTGLIPFPPTNPAMNHWAIVTLSLRDDGNLLGRGMEPTLCFVHRHGFHRAATPRSSFKLRWKELLLHIDDEPPRAPHPQTCLFVSLPSLSTRRKKHEIRTPAQK